MNHLNSPLNPIQLTQLFGQMGTETNETHGYLASDGKNFKVVHLKKQTFHFFSLQELLELTHSMKESFKTDPIKAANISKELKRMGKQKSEKENKRFIILRLALKIFQCVTNLFKGFGWNTTAGFATKLSKEFDLDPPSASNNLPPEKNSVTNAPPPKKSSVRNTPLSENQDLLAAVRPRGRQGTPGKSKAIAAYKKDPVNCSAFYKNILFREVESVNQLLVLIKEITGENTLNLENIWCKHVIKEALNHVKKETSDLIIAELLNTDDFSPSLFIDFLQLILDKAKESKPYSQFSLILLMKFYRRHSWHEKKLSFDDPVYLEGVKLMINSAPNDKQTEKLIIWMKDQEGFSQEISQFCIDAYTQKRSEKNEGGRLDILYPVLETLERNHNSIETSDSVSKR